MGIFSKLFNQEDNKDNNPPQQKPSAAAPSEESDKKSVSFMVLYPSAPKVNEASFQKRIEQALGESLKINIISADDESLIVMAKVGTEDLSIVRLGFPYPKQILDEIIPICHCSQADKAKFYESGVHIMFSLNLGDQPAHVQMDRLYQLVNCLLAEDPNMIGIINESAMTANTLSQIKKVGEERSEMLSGKAMPFWSWMSFTGAFVKFILDEETIWYVTKGNHQFGIPELAYKGGYMEGNETLELFNALFSYMYGYQAKLAVGHTAEIGEMQLKFTALQEYKEVFEGKYGTLVVNITNK